MLSPKACPEDHKPGKNAPDNAAMSPGQGNSNSLSISLQPLRPSGTSSQKSQIGQPFIQRQRLCNAHKVPGVIIDAKHVFLGVKCGSDYQVADIDVSALNDTQFFYRLKCKYLSTRGWWRNVFSWWRYDHCDFYRFRKYAPESYTVCQRQFPRKHDYDYEFQPRPMEPVPPIDDHEFRMRFYHSCETPHSWHMHQCKRFSTSHNQAISILPKRIQPLEAGGDERNDFWGIYARERRAFPWVAAYVVLCNAPATAFIFVWLFGLGHTTDLQDGTVPVGLSLTLTLGFIALLRESREPDRK